LVAVLADLQSEGFDVQFTATAAGGIECANCGATSPGDSVDVVRRRRMEGASDPDDMMTVIAAACPSCGRRGTLVMGYGPNASEADIALMGQLPATRSS
jgi:hypothetical protein